MLFALPLYIGQMFQLCYSLIDTHMIESFLGEVSAYIRVILTGMVATALYNICAAVLWSIGNSFTPLIFLVISNVLNIVLDYVCIRHLGMGVSGVRGAGGDCDRKLGI